jgi:AcrR family transcriptional regulator
MDTMTPRRSDIGRERIIAAARPLFAARGYERTTIRSIAEAAAINPALVIRYCGSKEALFAEVAALDLKIERLAGMPVDKLGAALVSHVLDLWEDKQDGAALAAMVRATIASDSARMRIIAQFGEQIARFFVAVEPTLLPAAPLVATQIIGLTMARFVWRLPIVVALPRAEVIRRFGRALQRHIDVG